MQFTYHRNSYGGFNRFPTANKSINKQENYSNNSNDKYTRIDKK